MKAVKDRSMLRPRIAHTNMRFVIVRLSKDDLGLLLGLRGRHLAVLLLLSDGGCSNIETKE